MYFAYNTTNASKCDPHKYFYYLEPIYYGTLATHSMSSSFAPIFGDEEVKTAISYIQPFQYTESVQIENSYESHYSYVYCNAQSAMLST